jgi:hypothetical protein
MLNKLCRGERIVVGSKEIYSKTILYHRYFFVSDGSSLLIFTNFEDLENFLR